MSQPFDQEARRSSKEEGHRQQLKLLVRDDLYRAFQRCTWILVHETGRSQVEIMDELVQDFLVKHGC